MIRGASCTREKHTPKNRNLNFYFHTVVVLVRRGARVEKAVRAREAKQRLHLSTSPRPPPPAVGPFNLAANWLQHRSVARRLHARLETGKPKNVYAGQGGRGQRRDKRQNNRGKKKKAFHVYGMESRPVFLLSSQVCALGKKIITRGRRHYDSLPNNDDAHHTSNGCVRSSAIFFSFSSA